MRKLTRKNLDELAMVMPALSERTMNACIGGGDGSFSNPLTYDEYKKNTTQGSVYYYNKSGELCYNLPDVTVNGGSTKSDESGSHNAWLAYLETIGFLGGSYNGGSGLYENWFQSSTNSGSVDEAYQGNSGLLGFGFGVVGDLGDAAKEILDDRGKYMPDGKIYTLKTPITVRLPIGVMDTNAQVLNAVRVGGKWMGVIGNILSLGDIVGDLNSGNLAVGGAKAGVALLQAGCSFIPGVGWAISIGIGIADVIWGEDLYNSLK